MGRQHSTFRDGCEEMSQEEGFCRGLWVPRDGGNPKVTGEHMGPCRRPLFSKGTRVVGCPGLILNLGQNTIYLVLYLTVRTGEARQ